MTAAAGACQSEDDAINQRSPGGPIKSLLISTFALLTATFWDGWTDWEWEGTIMRRDMYIAPTSFIKRLATMHRQLVSEVRWWCYWFYVNDVCAAHQKNDPMRGSDGVEKCFQVEPISSI